MGFGPVCEKNFDDENYKWEGACLGARLTSDQLPVLLPQSTFGQSRPARSSKWEPAEISTWEPPEISTLLS